MRRSASDTHLSSGEWGQLQELLDRFEQAGPRPGPVDLGGFLPPPGAAAPPAADPRKTGALLPVFGGYKLVKRLGKGNFGEVWQAEAPGGVEAAIKVIFRPLHHSEAKRELESLELMKRLRHPFL